MFTGLISDIGMITALERKSDWRARIATAYRPESIDMGASIACDGICLTVVNRGATAPEDTARAGGRPGWFEVEISAESIAKTKLSRQSAWPVGAAVNLERALRMGDELGGHIVSGHVDGVAQIEAIEEVDASRRFTIRAPEALAPFIAAKGSVTLDGTSLTVNHVAGLSFDVNIIPHTQAVTTWGQMAVGDPLNIEIDMLARYLQRLREFEK